MEDSERVRLNLKPVERVPAGTLIPISVEGRGYGLNGRGLGTRILRVVHLPSLELGPQTWQDVYVGVEDLESRGLSEGGDQKANPHAILGDELLARHGAVIDFSSLTLWLRPDR
jgi:hypothetical protein